MNSASDPSGVRRGSAEHQDFGIDVLRTWMEYELNMNYYHFPPIFLMADSI